MSGNKKRQRILKLSMLGLEALLLAAVIIVSVSVVNNINSVRNNINNKIIAENQANDSSNEINESHSGGGNGGDSDNNAAPLSVNAVFLKSKTNKQFSMDKNALYRYSGNGSIFNRSSWKQTEE